MAKLDVIRMTPPEIGTCRAADCGKAIEWVLTAKTGRRMPVDAPLVAEDVVEHVGGKLVTTIDGGASHFATCPAAKSFRRAR